MFMKIFMHRYLHILTLFGRNIISRGGGGLNFVKTKDRNFEFFFCMLTFFITNVCNLECLTDRHMQESRKNHQNCLMPLHFEMLYGNYLGGTCTAFVLLKY